MTVPSTLQLNAAAGFAVEPDELALASGIAELADPVLITRAALQAPGPVIVAVSPGMTALTQYTTEELIGRTPRLFQGPLTERAVLDQLRLACERGQRFIGETVNYRKDGSAYILQWTVDPLRDHSGRVTHFFSVQRDVTEHRPFARQWLEAEARARAALSNGAHQMALIAEAILVLEQTKRSFKSKELGTLRQRLAEASRELPHAAGRNTAAIV